MDEKKEPKKKSKTEDAPGKELHLIVGAMAVLIVAFFAFSFFFQSLKTFEYEGLTFRKDHFGEIPIYVYTYNSLLTPRAIDTQQVNVVLRGDPRENIVPFEGELELPYGKFVYITHEDEGISQCEYGALSVSSLSSFLASNGFRIKGGVADETLAEENDLEYYTCENHPDNPVISFSTGEETKITRDGNCYSIQVNNCEVLPAVEKFIVRSLIDARSRTN